MIMWFLYLLIIIVIIAGMILFRKADISIQTFIEKAEKESLPVYLKKAKGVTGYFYASMSESFDDFKMLNSNMAQSLRDKVKVIEVAED